MRPVRVIGIFGITRLLSELEGRIIWTGSFMIHRKKEHKTHP
jgi:hypothetical protein